MATRPIHPISRCVRRFATHLAAAVPDEQLLERFARQHDEAAFAALVRRHGPLVMGACRRVLQDWHAAEDCFQATFIILARKAGSLREPQRLGPWLYGVACRTARKARAREARRRAFEQRAAAPAVQHGDEGAWRDLRPVLDEAVGRLPDKYRLPFVLHHLQGVTIAQVAQQLGCPMGTVAARLARAKERLRDRLSRRGVAPSAGALAAALSEGVGTAAVPASLACATARAAHVALASLHAVPVVNGVLGTMLTSKLAAAAVVVGVAVGATGIGVLTRNARAEGGSGAVALPQAAEADPVEQIYATLRERRTWTSPAKDYHIWVHDVRGHRLLGVFLQRFDEQGRADLLTSCPTAELKVDARQKTLDIQMTNAIVTGSDGSRGEFAQRTCEVSLAPPQAASHAVVNRTLRTAFGRDCKEVQSAIKLEFRSRGLVLAADAMNFEGDGRPVLFPCRLAMFDGTAVRGDKVRLTFDGPVRTPADMGRRKITAVEPVGNVRITFPEGE
jgi:RNA polymerase sigma factor (sigma-70 family)